MATTQYTGVIYGDYNKQNRLRINYTVSQDDVNAISTITMKLYAERTNTYRQYNKTGSSYWNLTGKENTYINFDWVEGSTEYYLGDSSTTVQHNPEGVGSVTLSGYWYTGRKNSNSIPESMSISQTITLKTIPRASTVSGGSGNIGSKTTISVSRKSNSFTHTLRYSFSDLTGTIATGVGTSYEWTIPTSFYAKIPYAKSYNGTIYCDTYNGSTLIGTKSTTFTATASESSSRPTVTGTVVDVNETTKALTGNANKLILGKSTARITVNPVARNSAVITKVTIDGVADTDYSTDKANVTKASFPIVVTDSRGYTNTAYSATATGGIVNYFPLTLNVSFFRPQPTTGEVQLTYSGNFFNGNFGARQNTVGIEWHYRVKGSDTWIKGGIITPTINGNIIEKRTISLGTTYDYQTAYEFYLYSQDCLTYFSNVTTVSVGEPVFYWGKNFLNVNHNLNLKADGTSIAYKQAGVPLIRGDGTNAIVCGNGGTIYLRPNGNTNSSNQATLSQYGDFTNTGRATSAQGTSVKRLNNGAGTSGYMHACQLKVSAQYRNQPIIFRVVQRGRNGEIKIAFANNDTNGTWYSLFSKNGNINAYIYQSSTSVWDLYIQKVEAYDEIEIVELHRGIYMDTVSITWKNTVVTSLPTGYISPTIDKYPLDNTISLYDNSAGTTGTVTLSDSAANYAFIEIFFKNSYSFHSSVKVYSPNGKCALLQAVHVHGSSSGTATAETRIVDISGTTLSTGTSDSYGKWWSYGNRIEVTNHIHIIKVIGYK